MRPGFAVGGFAYWEADPVLHQRYWDGLASVRPAACWLWANLALLGVCAGPVLFGPSPSPGAASLLSDRSGSGFWSVAVGDTVVSQPAMKVL